MNHLDTERMRFVELRRRLLELHPDLDEQTLLDTLEGATDFSEALTAVIGSALDDECLAVALKERLDAMRTRLARLQSRAASKRIAAVESMETTQMRKLVAPDFTASMRLGPPSVAITDEQLLPGDYLVPQPPKADKRGLLDALTRGLEVPGATLCQPRVSLAIRSQ